MTKFKLLSDLHLEFAPYIDRVPEDSANIHLILAGDVCPIKMLDQLVKFLETCCANYKSVVYIMGNHEYYKGSLSHSIYKLYEAKNHLNNLYVLDDDSIILDGVKVIGSTLWTDLNGGDPVSKMLAESGMNDYRQIRHGTNSLPYKFKLRANDVIVKHITSLNYIREELASFDGKKLVVTHHAPSFKSVPEKYKSGRMNHAYCSDLSELIYNNDIDVWCHGHTHSSFDYDFLETRIIANPRGYSAPDYYDYMDQKDLTSISDELYASIFKDENRQFDRNKVFEI